MSRSRTIKVFIAVCVLALAIGVTQNLIWATSKSAIQDSGLVALSNNLCTVNHTNGKSLHSKSPIEVAKGKTVRNTCVYTVIDASNKVHRAITEDADVRIVGLVGRSGAIVEANEAGRVRLTANPRLTIGGTPMKTLPDVPLRAGELTVVPLRTEDLALIEKTVASNGGEVLGRCGTLSKPNLRIRGTEETIAALMDLAEARWIENYERPHFFNYNSARTIHVNECWPTSAGDDCGTTGLGLTGRGQLITTADSGIDTGDVNTMTEDLRPNVVGCSVSYPNYAVNCDLNGHGTHTAGSMVGTGMKNAGKYKGMAHEAKLWAWMCGASDGSGDLYVVEPVNWAFRPPDYIVSYSQCGLTAHIFSASYGSVGSDWQGLYSSETASIDEFCWENPDFLPCWAAGNSGSKNGTITTHGASKNALIVGASNGDGVASTSSRGPTKDSRVKPDVCAPGVNVTSCNSSVGKNASRGDYITMSGTSMATPLTAGTCALLRQWLVEKRGLKKPSSALMKAILMGGATKLKSVAKTAQGEGRVNLRASIAPEDALQVYLADWIPIGDGQAVTNYLQTVEDAPFDAQLVWVDYPGDATAAQEKSKLVNDLDLRVEAVGGFVETALPNGQVWLGNGGTEPDRLNNAESVHDASFPKGRYRIIIEGNNLPHDYTGASGKGAVALYVRGAFDASRVLPAEPNVSGFMPEKWAQTKPYNDLVPAYLPPGTGDTGYEGWGGHVPVGCVATAMAQAMHYWNWPRHFEFSKTSSHSVNLDNGKLSFSVEHQVAAGVQLVYDDSDACKARLSFIAASLGGLAFNRDGTGGLPQTVAEALSEYYVVPPSCDDYYLRGYLKLGYPVPATIEGHAVVLHGWKQDEKGNDLFYMNYGNSGAGDRWIDRTTIKSLVPCFPKKMAMFAPLPAKSLPKLTIEWAFPEAYLAIYPEAFTGFTLTATPSSSKGTPEATLSLGRTERSYTFTNLTEGETYLFEITPNFGTLADDDPTVFIEPIKSSVTTTIDSSAPSAPTIVAPATFAASLNSWTSFTLAVSPTIQSLSVTPSLKSYTIDGTTYDLADYLRLSGGNGVCTLWISPIRFLGKSDNTNVVLTFEGIDANGSHAFAETLVNFAAANPPLGPPRQPPKILFR